MPPFTILYRGVPVGIAELDPGQPIAAGPVTVLPGYAEVRLAARAAGLALLGLQRYAPAALDAALAHPARARGPVGEAARLPTIPGWPEAGAARAALRAAAALGRRLELHDTAGAYVAADFVELVEWPRAASAGPGDREEAAPDVGAWAGFGLAGALVPARPAPRRAGGLEAAPPAG